MNEFNISQENWDKIIDYARIAYDNYRSEIGGMAIMMKDNDGDWNVMRPVILKQEISSSNTIIDKDALAKYYTKEAIYMEKEHPGINYRFLWWHSHHTMDAFWSSTDHAAIEEFNEGDMSFALVVNLKQEYKFRVSIWKPLKVAQDVELNITDKPDAKLSKKMIKEVEDMCVKEMKVINTHLGWNNYSKQRNIGQSALWDEPYDSIDTFMNLASYDPTFQELYQNVDELVDRCMEGTIHINTFLKEMRALEKEARQSNYEWKIVVPSKAKVIDAVMTSDGATTFIQPRKEL